MRLKQLGWLSASLLLMVIVGQAQATDWYTPWKKEATAGQRYSKPHPILKDDEPTSELDPTVGYIKKVTGILAKNWLPPYAKTEMNCAVVTLFDVNSVGTMVAPKVLSSSCSQQMTDSVQATLRANEQLPKPSSWVRTPVRIEFTFNYVAKR